MINRTTPISIKVPDVRGYDFIEWDKDLDELANIDTDVIVNAIYRINGTPIDKYRLTFYNFYGEVFLEKYVSKEEIFTYPNAHLVMGYDFVGWDINDNLFKYLDCDLDVYPIYVLKQDDKKRLK